MLAWRRGEIVDVEGGGGGGGGGGGVMVGKKFDERVVNGKENLIFFF